MRLNYKKASGTVLKYIGLILFGVGAGLVILEAILALVPDQALNLLISRRPIRHQLYQTDPNIGWRLKPNARYRHALDDEYDVLVQTNSKGLNDVEHTYEKPTGVFRILILGDSYAEAASVPISQNFSRLLQDCLSQEYTRPVEVINAGVSYYSTAEELFFFQHEGIRYEPDLVLVAFYAGNDIEAFEARKQADGWLDVFGGYLIELDEAGHLKKRWIDWEHPSPYEDITPIQSLLRRYSKIYRLVAHSDSKIEDWPDEQFEDFSQTTLGQRLGSYLQRERSQVGPSFAADLDLMIFSPNSLQTLPVSAKLVEAWAIIEELFVQLQKLSSTHNTRLGVLIFPTREQAHQHYYD